jgi:hypothetical protein
MRFKQNDGGKADAGLGTARAGDCVIRAIAIAEDQGYRKTKAELNELLHEMTGGLQRSCNNGTPTPVSHKYLTDRGYELVLTPKMYLQDLDFSEMTVIAKIPRHMMTIINNCVNDKWDSRKSRRTKCGSPKLEGYYFKPNKETDNGS